MDYNKLVMEDVKSAYTSYYEELGDLNELLAVKNHTSTCTLHGTDYIMVKHSLRDGNNPRVSKKMNDRDRQSYMVSLVKWVNKIYEDETLQEMAARGIPPKKVRSHRVSRYNEDPTITRRQSIKAYMLA